MRIVRFVMLSAFVMGLGLATEARADCNWIACQDSCNTYCTNKHQTCESFTFTGNCGVLTCSFECDGGSGLTWNCNGPVCGGSPIFRKQETSVREGQAREDSLLPAPDRRPATPARRPATDLAALACP